MLLKLLQILNKVENCSSIYFYWNNSKTDSGLKMKKMLQKKMFDSSKVYLKDCKSISFWWKNLSLPLTKSTIQKSFKKIPLILAFEPNSFKLHLFQILTHYECITYTYYTTTTYNIITKPIYLLLLPPYILVKVLRKSQNYKSAAV